MKHILFFLFSSFCFSFPVQTIKVKGISKFNDISLRKGSVFSRNGNLETDKDAFVKVFVEKWGVEMILAPMTKVEMKSAEGEFHVELLQGAVFWHSKKTGAKGKIKTTHGLIKSNEARFIARQDLEMKESEVIVLKSSVLFSSDMMKKQAQVISQGHWGGVGGRFGKVVGPELKVPESFIKSKKNIFSDFE